ncbi:hypothetical protein OXX79_008441 [Metschnikowia pulcherrima]
MPPRSDSRRISPKPSTRRPLNGPRVRQNVLIDHKRLLKAYSEENPGHSLDFYTDWFRNKFGYAPHKSTISRTIDLSGKKQIDKAREQAERFGGNVGKKIKFRQADHPEFEKELMEYLLKHEANVPFSGALIRKIALDLWKSKDRDATKEFKASGGWLQGFLNGFEYYSYTRHGEAASIDEEDLKKFRERLQEEISEYAPADIWNYDETGLWWKKFPRRGNTCKRYSGKKGGTYSRITAMLCCNANGSDKFRPWFIGKQDHYECFGENNAMLDPLDCHYSGREKALMDVDLMESWLGAFNHYVKQKGRKVILLMSNHSSRKRAVRIMAAAKKLDSVKVQFLPPNTTSKLQPLNQGIICKFKSGYAKRWLRFLIRCSEKSIDPMKRATMLDAVKWGIWAWDEVDADCIYHCWRHTGYFKKPSDNPVKSASETLSGSADSTESSEMIHVSSLEEDIGVVDGLLAELHRRKIIDENITGMEFLDSIGETPLLQAEEAHSSESATVENEIEQTLAIRNETPLETDQVSQDDSHVESGTDNRYKSIYEHKEALKSIDYLVEYLEEHEIDRKDLKYRLYLKGLRSEIARL